MSITKFGKKLLVLTLALVACFSLVACTLTTTDSPLDIAEETANANVKTVLEKINWDKTAMEDITSSLTLVTANKNFPDVSITWESSEPDVIANDGTVKRPNFDDPRARTVVVQNGTETVSHNVVDVVLTVTVKSTYTAAGEKVYETEAKTRTYNFSVLTMAEGTFFGTIAECKAAAWNYIYNEVEPVSKVGLLSADTKVFNAMTTGVVVAKLMDSDTSLGYIIDDGTAGIYVYASVADIKVGDTVEVIGGIYTYYGSIQFGTEITATVVADQGITVSQPVHYTAAELDKAFAPDETGAYSDSQIGYFGGITVEVEGYLREKSAKAALTGSHGVYCLEDAKTGDEIWFYYKGYNTEGVQQFTDNLDKYVKVTGVTYDKDSRLGKMELLITGQFEETDVPQVSDADKLAIAMNNIILSEKYDASFELPTLADATVAWEVVSGTTITIEGGYAKVKCAEEATEVVLKATVTVGTASDTKEFTVIVPAAITANYLPEFISEALEGTYKFALYQAILGQWQYATGELNSSEYLATTTKAVEAADFVVAAVEGGYTITVNGKYVEIYENANQKIRVRLAETSSYVWTWNETFKMFQQVLTGCEKSTNDATYFLGNYKTYNTFSASNITYMTADVDGVSQFAARFAGLIPADNKFIQIEDAAAGTYKFGLYQAILGEWQYATGELNSSEYLATTTKAAEAADFVVAAVEGGYTITVNGKFVEIYENANQKIRVRLADTSSYVWTWNETFKMFQQVLTGCAKSTNDATYFLGNYKTYNTFSASNITYMTADVDGVSQFAARFGKFELNKTVHTPIEAAAEGTYIFAMYQATLKKWLYATGEINSKGAFATTDNYGNAVAFVIAAVEGGYTITLNGKFVELYETETQYVNLRLADTSTYVWTWNETFKMFEQTLTDCAKESNNNTYCLCAYSNKDAMASGKSSFVTAESDGTSEFVARFGNMEFVKEEQGGGEDNPPTPPVGPTDPEHAGTAEDPYSVADIAIVYNATTLTDGSVTDKEIYVKGIISSVSQKSGKTGAYAGNMYLVDAAGDTVNFLVYSVNYDENTTIVYVNDTVVVKGYIKNYYGTIEMTNITIEETAYYPSFISRTVGTSTVSVATDSSANATVNLSANSAENGSQVTFTVTPAANYNIKSVKVNGTVVEAVEGTYTATVAGPTTVSVATEAADAKKLVVAATFQLGTGPADPTKTGHQDGAKVDSYTEKSGDYTLTLSNLTNVYGSAQDGSATENGCIKLGTSKASASFTFTVPSDVKKVIVYVAGYKANDGEITINGGTAIKVVGHSSDGVYDAIEIDTSVTKTITIATTSSVYRAMFNAIAFYIEEK